MRTQWRRDAAACLQAIDVTANPEIKVMLLSTAERWAKRADQQSEPPLEAESTLESTAPGAR
jgi:hypothetical protein